MNKRQLKKRRVTEGRNMYFDHLVGTIGVEGSELHALSPSGCHYAVITYESAAAARRAIRAMQKRARYRA